MTPKQPSEDVVERVQAIIEAAMRRSGAIYDYHTEEVAKEIIAAMGNSNCGEFALIKNGQTALIKRLVDALQNAEQIARVANWPENRATFKDAIEEAQRYLEGKL